VTGAHQKLPKSLGAHPFALFNKLPKSTTQEEPLDKNKKADGPK